MTTVPIRDANLFVKVLGKGYPLLLMHGGPGVDHTTLLSLKPLAEQFSLIFGFGHLLKGWTVMDRLGEIKTPALVMAGRQDFQFPPEHQKALAAGLANARLKIIEQAGHNAHVEKTAEVIQAIKEFLTSVTPL